MADVIALGILAHLIGDYLLQSHWMATEKVKRWPPAIAHAVTYGLPFLLITQSPGTLALIVATHAVIDRYRLAKHVVWAKNQLAPKAYRSDHTATGYPEETPAWLAVWLLIIADNSIHLSINSAALLAFG